MLSPFSHAQCFAPVWTVVRPAPCPRESPSKNGGMGHQALLQGSFQPKDQTPVSHGSCNGKQFTFFRVNTVGSTTLRIQDTLKPKPEKQHKKTTHQYSSMNTDTKFKIFFFGHTTQHEGSSFPHQGSGMQSRPPALEAQSLNHWT